MDFHTISNLLGLTFLILSWTVPKLIKNNDRLHAYVSGTLNGFGLACFILGGIFGLFF